MLTNTNNTKFVCTRMLGHSLVGLTIAFVQPGCASNDSPPAVAVIAVVALTPATVTAPVTTGANCGLADLESSSLDRINQYRAKGANCRTAGQFAATRPLVWNALLQRAASSHSQDMATKNYVSHTSLDGRSMFDRINATGYGWSAVGENIAATVPSVNAVVDGWMASDKHCANLMKAVFREMALTCEASTTSKYGAYWTMDVGAPR